MGILLIQAAGFGFLIVAFVVLLFVIFLFRVGSSNATPICLLDHTAHERPRRPVPFLQDLGPPWPGRWWGTASCRCGWPQLPNYEPLATLGTLPP